MVFIWSLKLQNRRKKKIKKSNDNTSKASKIGVFANNRTIYKCRYTLLKEIKNLFRNAVFTVFSRTSCKVVQQIVQLKNVNVNLFVGKPTERFFASDQFIGKFIIDRISKADLLLLKYIGIDVRCYANVAMTKVFRDHFQVYTAVQQKRGVTVAELM